MPRFIRKRLQNIGLKKPRYAKIGKGLTAGGSFVAVGNNRPQRVKVKSIKFIRPTLGGLGAKASGNVASVQALAGPSLLGAPRRTWRRGGPAERGTSDRRLALSCPERWPAPRRARQGVEEPHCRVSNWRWQPTRPASDRLQGWGAAARRQGLG